MSLTDYTTDQDKKQEQRKKISAAATHLHLAMELLKTVDCFLLFDGDYDGNRPSILLSDSSPLKDELLFHDLFDSEWESLMGGKTLLHKELCGVDIRAYRREP